MTGPTVRKRNMKRRTRLADLDLTNQRSLQLRSIALPYIRAFWMGKQQCRSRLEWFFCSAIVRETASAHSLLSRTNRNRTTNNNNYTAARRTTSVCLLHSLEDILLRTVLFIKLLSCLRSDSVILDTLIVLLTYLLTYTMFIFLTVSPDVAWFIVTEIGWSNQSYCVEIKSY